MRSAVILAGGRGRRIGEDKASLRLLDTTMLGRCVAILSDMADEIIVVARDQTHSQLLRDLVPDTKVTWDIVAGQGPLSGLASGMGLAAGRYSLAVGCDMPFLCRSIIEQLFDQAEDYDGVVPLQDGHAQRLHAVYRTKAMEVSCRNALFAGCRRIDDALSQMRISYIVMDGLTPHMKRSFMNINTKADLEQAISMICREEGSYIKTTSRHALPAFSSSRTGAPGK